MQRESCANIKKQNESHIIVLKYVEVFRTGSVLIVGGWIFDILNEIYNYLSKLLCIKYQNIYSQQRKMN